MEKMFESATRLKVKFETTKGMITVEDLWDIPLTSRTTGFSLDDIAKNLNKQVKESAEESFVVKKSTKNETLELKFEIIKYIIKRRLEEREAANNELAKATQKEKLLQLLSEKKDENLKSKTVEEIEQMLKELS